MDIFFQHSLLKKITTDKDQARGYCLCLRSSDTVNFFLPLALLDANTDRPLGLDIRSLKPCLFLRFLCDG